jgi:hypothetical protein
MAYAPTGKTGPADTTAPIYGAGIYMPNKYAGWGQPAPPTSDASTLPMPGAPMTMPSPPPVTSAGADVAPPPMSLTALSEPNAPNSAGSAGSSSPDVAPMGPGGGGGVAEGWGQLPMTGLVTPGGRSVPASTTALAQIGTQRGRVY